MKKITTFCAAVALVFAVQVAKAQGVHDRAIIPVAVTLNPVLRLTVIDGGNIEFVFNTIDDYLLGQGALTSAAAAGATPATAITQYLTRFTVASSTRWTLNYGYEEATMLGTDRPANTLAWTNIGFSLAETGAYDITRLLSAPQPLLDGSEVQTPQVFPTALISNVAVPAAGNSNAGSALDNAFTIAWRCGTGSAAVAPATSMAGVLLEQAASPYPDRYVGNILFELKSNIITF